MLPGLHRVPWDRERGCLVVPGGGGDGIGAGLGGKCARCSSVLEGALGRGK